MLRFHMLHRLTAVTGRCSSEPGSVSDLARLGGFFTFGKSACIVPRITMHFQAFLLL